MTLYLTNKNILLGVTGSIAAYKSADLVRRLRGAGAEVRVVMTTNAKQFITPLTMQAVSGYPVHEDLFDLHAEAAMGHIELARWADVVLIAPATADFMARLAHGNANDLLTTICLATRAPTPMMIAPAMNQNMWKHTLTQDNLQVLKQKNMIILEPSEGSQACGDVGPGRMMEPIDIMHTVSAFFSSNTLSSLQVLVTAGPTHEAIDPIRFITNGGTGKMGYALAEAAGEAGAKVTLISGPVMLPAPKHIKRISVISAQEMYDAVMRNVTYCDIFLAVASVGDYRCQTVAEQKIHKQADEVQLRLKRNPDIVTQVAQLSSKPFIVGFAAETEQVVQRAKLKREKKNMDMIIANDVSGGLGKGCDENEVTVITRTNDVHLSTMSKRKLARQLIAIIAENFRKREK